MIRPSRMRRGTSSAFARVTALAEQRAVHEAFHWLHLQNQQLLHQQAELVAIPAPPFGEAARAAWTAERFAAMGMEEISIDAAGNVLARFPSPERTESGVVLLSAHLDTVFPIETQLEPVMREDRLEAPGACDNGAGVIGMLAVVQAMRVAGIEPKAALWVAGNVGEEGEGDLRGIRHIYQYAAFRERIVSHIVLDGAGSESAVTHALGSRRFQVRISGPGGHSFTDAGTVNPILALCDAMRRLEQAAALDEQTRTTFNLGTISGGTSVNSIPESATASVDFRSTETAELVRLEVALHRAVEDAVETANAAAKLAAQRRGCTFEPLRMLIQKIGDRPTGSLPQTSVLMETLRAVDRHLHLRTDLRLGSTDANLPLALGVPALSMGAGGDGGAAHTRAEWYSGVNRTLGLKRVLLLTLAVLEQAMLEQTMQEQTMQEQTMQEQTGESAV